MTQDTHPFAWNSPLSHAPRPNQVRARRTRCRSLQHVHTTDLEDYATPGIYWWESSGETRWTVLLPSLPASVKGHCASQVATPRGLAAWHSLEPGRGRMNCQLVCAKLYFCPHNPVQGERWPGGFTKCSVTISVVSKRFLGPSPVRLRRGRIPECGRNKVSRILSFEDTSLATQSWDLDLAHHRLSYHPIRGQYLRLRMQSTRCCRQTTSHQTVFRG